MGTVLFIIVIIAITVIASISAADSVDKKEKQQREQEELLKQQREQEELLRKQQEQSELQETIKESANSYVVRQVNQVEEYSKLLNSLKEVPITKSDAPVEALDIDDMPEMKVSRAPRDSEKANLLCDYVVIDVETTGISVKSNRLLEITAVRFIGFEPTEYISTLVNPQKKIPADATAINGITNDMVKDSPLVGDIAQSFIDFIGKERIIIGHNIEFDAKFLYAAGINLFISRRKFYDTLAIAKTRLKRHDRTKAMNAEIYDRDYSYDVYDYQLETLLDYYDIFTPQSHRSLHDSIATGKLFKELLDE